MPRDRIVALGLLSQRDLDTLGPSFYRVYPVDEAPCFGELLAAIDEADRGVWRRRDSHHAMLAATDACIDRAKQRPCPSEET